MLAQVVPCHKNIQNKLLHPPITKGERLCYSPHVIPGRINQRSPSHYISSSPALAVMSALTTPSSNSPSPPSFPSPSPQRCTHFSLFLIFATLTLLCVSITTIFDQICLHLGLQILPPQPRPPSTTTTTTILHYV